MAFAKKELNNNLQDALNKITDYLARRDHSEHELRMKMSRRFTKEIIQEAISEAQERGWFKKPEELAEMVSASLFRRGKGPLYINGYLRKKGLPTLSFENDYLLSQCQELLELKYPHWTEMSYEERQKPIRFLLRRGFPEGVVLSVITSARPNL